MKGTRPDIASAVAQVARFCNSSGRMHREAVCRIFKYLTGTVDLGLVYSTGEVSQQGRGGCDSKVVLEEDIILGDISKKLRVFSD